MLLMHNSACQLRVVTHGGEASQNAKAVIAGPFIAHNARVQNLIYLGTAAKFLHPAQNISLYTISLGNVSDSLGTRAASKSCRENALRASTEGGEAFALQGVHAGGTG